MEWETGLVFRDTRYLCLQNVTFWQAVKAELLLWLLLPWNNTAVCEETTSHFTILFPAHVNCIHTPLYLLFPRSAEEARIRGSEGLIVSEKYCFVFLGDHLLLWFKVLVASGEMNYWLENKVRGGREKERGGGDTPTNWPPTLIHCLLTHWHTETNMHIHLLCTAFMEL